MGQAITKQVLDSDANSPIAQKWVAGLRRLFEPNFA